MYEMKLSYTYTVELYTRVQVQHVLTRLTRAKVKKLVFARNFTRDFGMHMRDSKHTRDSKHATHESCMSRVYTWFATLHMWCNYRYSSSRQ